MYGRALLGMMPEALVKTMVEGESLGRVCVAGPLPGTGGSSNTVLTRHKQSYSMRCHRCSSLGRDGQLVKSAQPPAGWQAEGGAEAKR